MIERFGDDASKQATALCFDAIDDGDNEGAESWQAIADACFSLRFKRKLEGEVEH